MQNLAHSASPHSDVKIAPSNPGIKHLSIYHSPMQTSSVSGFDIAVIDQLTAFPVKRIDVEY